MNFTRDIPSTLCEVQLEPLEPRQLLAFGQLDETFGDVGHVFTDLPANVSMPLLQDIEVETDGTILAGGSGGLVEWNGSGAIVEDFGAAGRVPLPGATYRDHEIAPDGDIYVLASDPGGSIIVRYTSSGDVDATFGADGTVMISKGTAFTPSAIAVQEDGKVVVAGTARTDAGKGSIARLYRLENNGSADLNFGNTASIEVQLGSGSDATPIEKDSVAGIAILSGGRIVIGGSSVAYAPEVYIDELGIFSPAVYGDSVFATARFTADGQPDSTYGDHGVSRAVFASGISTEPVTSFAHRGLDDGIGVAGYTDRLAYAQFNASGVVAYNRLAETVDFGRPLDMAAKRDGRFMLVGLAESATGHGLQVTYVYPDGNLANIVQTEDVNPSTVDLQETAPAAVAVADDGNILIGGRANDGNDGYQLMKFDDGKVEDSRPDHFTNALGNDIVRDAEGGVHFTYFDAANAVLMYAYRGANGLWNSPVTVDVEPQSGHYLSIAVNANNRPGIAYFDGVHGDLKYAFSPADGEWNTQLVEGVGIVGLYPSLQFDTALRPTISYYKKTGGDLKLAVLKEDGEWAAEVIDSENDVGRSTALVAQPLSGRWSIAYTDTTTGAVKFAWRTKMRVWALETAATTQGGADFLSLAYNPSTEPAGVYMRAAISYFDAYNADLRITQSSGDGALVWTPRTLSMKGAVGLYTYLTFDAFFGPTVYYYNRTANRVMRLTDHFHDGVQADALAEGGGRFLSVFSDGNTIDIAYFDDDENTVKIRSMPIRA
jgi:uncharacterized delta-60 repeat protein